MKNKNPRLENRRKFLITVGNSSIGIMGAGTVGLIYNFLRPGIITELPSRFQVGSPDNFQPESFIFNEAHQLFIVRNSEGFFYAISSICTHLGCTVNKRPVTIPGQAEEVISCPCHGSIYSKTGEVISGPAPRPLDRFQILLEDGNLIVDTKKIVSEKDMFLRIR